MATNYIWDLLLSDDHTFPDDAKYAEELQLEEALMGSLFISEVEPCPDHEDGAKVGAYSAVGDSSMSFCGICMERKEKMEMFKGLSCAHSYCSDCVIKHVFTKLQENVSRVGCPELGCKVVLDLEACRRILPQWLIDDWSDLLCREMIDASQKFYCPYKDCSCMMFADVAGKGESGIAEAECPFCRRLFCARCSVPWHGGLGCKEYQKLGKDEKGRDDVMLMRLAKDKKWSRCPKCKFYVERTEGCAHMVCRCRYEFCYGCGEKWTESHSGCAKD